MLDLKDCGRVAQLVEQCPFKAWVAGSSPAALTIISLYSGASVWIGLDLAGAPDFRVRLLSLALRLCDQASGITPQRPANGMRADARIGRTVRLRNALQSAWRPNLATTRAQASEECVPKPAQHDR